MSDLIVLAFKTETGAEEMRDALIRIQKEQHIELDDAAVVVHKHDSKPRVKQATNLVGAGALGGAFWGMLIGILFFAPWVGMAIGAATGALAGKFTDIGVDDDFIKEVGAAIGPGHSALFLMVSGIQMDKLELELKNFGATIIQTSLSDEDEANLREMFGPPDEENSETTIA